MKKQYQYVLNFKNGERHKTLSDKKLPEVITYNDRAFILRDSHFCEYEETECFRTYNLSKLR